MTLTAPSSPPPPAVSPKHVTARVDSSEEEATRTPVHEPPVDGPSAHESWAHETPEEHTSGWGTWSGQPEKPSGHAGDGGEPSGHADDGGEPTDFEEEGEEGGNVYQRGATRLPSVPATHEQRWLTFPDGER